MKSPTPLSKGKEKDKKGGFYKHLDGSWCCKKCELTLNEGCKCYNK